MADLLLYTGWLRLHRILCVQMHIYVINAHCADSYTLLVCAGSAWDGKHISQRHGNPASPTEHGRVFHRQNQEVSPQQGGELSVDPPQGAVHLSMTVCLFVSLFSNKWVSGCVRACVHVCETDRKTDAHAPTTKTTALSQPNQLQWEIWPDSTWNSCLRWQ